VRRPPEVARQEILDATAYLLTRNPFRDLTIADIMNRTEIGRSAFYVYFKDIYAVVEALLVQIRDQELQFLNSWAEQELGSPEGVRVVVDNTVNLWATQGPMISAMMDAAASDARIEAAFDELTAAYSAVIARSLRREQAAGRVRKMNCEEIADLLVIGTQTYLKVKLGAPDASANAAELSAALFDAWSHAILGELPG
jgi:AcrR family transcriptional regulator